MKWFEKAVLASALVAAGSGAFAATGTESFNGIAGTKHYGSFGTDPDGTVKAISVTTTSALLQAFLNGTALALQSATNLGNGTSLYSFKLAGYTTAGYSFDINSAPGTAYTAVLEWDDTQAPALGTPVTAIPEPGTVGMLLAGAGIIAFMSRRRRVE